ncbi:hypothetical protein DLM_3869 [Aquitalea magnusonii]|uniref:Uncharacterized protein n=1 Tax=Aquitalea magnusonii TaxID=332411 RepID=A0A3G9GHU8_9NEIS|nr:hypothetical protein [Aquitalea magnusonii]BBF87448.1 hypothetical protein DLM_3869 [Aquitalea magnusonii]
MTNKPLIFMLVAVSTLLLSPLASATEHGGNGADIREARQMAQAQSGQAAMAAPGGASASQSAAMPDSMRRPSGEK